MNMNDIARTVTLEEAGKKEISIAQVKEVLKVFLKEISTYSDDEILKLVDKYRK